MCVKLDYVAHVRIRIDDGQKARGPALGESQRQAFHVFVSLALTLRMSFGHDSAMGPDDQYVLPYLKTSSPSSMRKDTNAPSLYTMLSPLFVTCRVSMIRSEPTSCGRLSCSTKSMVMSRYSQSDIWAWGHAGIADGGQRDCQHDTDAERSQCMIVKGRII